VARIWENQWLTNRGALVQELEEKLIEHLGFKYVTLKTNGTLPTQIAIKALGLSGEIITTPFNYVATTSSIVWEGCQPVFVDIDPVTCNLDPSVLESAITSKQSQSCRFTVTAIHAMSNVLSK